MNGYGYCEWAFNLFLSSDASPLEFSSGRNDWWGNRWRPCHQPNSLQANKSCVCRTFQSICYRCSFQLLVLRKKKNRIFKSDVILNVFSPSILCLETHLLPASQRKWFRWMTPAFQAGLLQQRNTNQQSLLWNHSIRQSILSTTVAKDFCKKKMVAISSILFGKSIKRIVITVAAVK